MTMAVRAKSRKTRDAYLELVLRFPLRPIRSGTELNQAVAMIDSLLDLPRLKAAQKDYLDVLSDLVERYETEHHAIPPLPDSVLLRHLIETKGLPQGRRGPPGGDR
jgi:HTH-type transcriptional regulator/antitoxin HigA